MRDNATRVVVETQGVDVRTGDVIRHYQGGSTLVYPMVRVMEGPHAPNGRRVQLDYGDWDLRNTWIMDDQVCEVVS